MTGTNLHNKLHQAHISEDILVENKVLNNKIFGNNIHLLSCYQVFQCLLVHTSKNVI